ncbi:hypothetical protein LEN26_009873 [Aphanomyces euteiches]|nr:hypothetical protein AeMF1_021874 [Aphanomyces euteiches]KAH9123661.1 hypothetical protein LEN26_009873 [Aphanomyces euteiches]
MTWAVYSFGTLALMLSLSMISPTRIESTLFAAVFGLFLLFVGDELLRRYQTRNLLPVEPRPDGVVVLTGASSGLGREMAYILAEKRYHLVLVARSEGTLHRMAKELHDVWDITAHVCNADLSSPAGPQQVMDFVKKHSLQVDILINCAGGTKHGDFTTVPEKDVTDLMHLNVLSYVEMCHLFLPGMHERRSGRILNVASIAAGSPMPGVAMYGGSKAFLIRFSQALAYECRGVVGITAFCPGPLHTPFGDTAGIGDALVYKLPWVVDTKVSAKAAVDAVLDGTWSTTFDSWTSKIFFHTGMVFGEKQLAALFCAVCWSTPKTLVGSS